MTTTVEEPAIQEDREKLSVEFNPLAWILWIIGFILSVVAAWLLLVKHGETDSFPWIATLCHLLATVLVGAGTGLALSLADSTGWGWACLSAFFAFLVGPVGVVMGVFCYLMARGQPTGMPLVEVIKAEMWIRQEDPVEEDLMPLDLKIREELRTEPFVDLLPYADVPTAMAIIKRLKERGHKRDIQMLRGMTQDQRPEVYQAAIAQLDKLEGYFSGRIFAISQELEASPHKAELRLELAGLYLEYRESGLLEEGLEDYYWELTLSQVLEAMLAHPGGGVLTVDLARLLHDRDLVDESAAVAEAGLKKDPHNIHGQLLVLQSIVQNAQEKQDPNLFSAARKRALESAWAVKTPKRTSSGDPTHELAKFWFEGREKGA